jgi:hypothetical protein
VGKAVEVMEGGGRLASALGSGGVGAEVGSVSVEALLSASVRRAMSW